MRKKNNGFTLIELLATITILGILLGIAIPAVMGYMNKGKETYYHSLEDSVLNSARDYLIDYRSLYPREIGNTATISGEELLNNKYITNIDDEDGNSCDATVIVEKTDKDKYDYHVCLKCGNNYSSSDEECNLDGNQGTTRNYTIEVESFPTEVRQGDELVLPNGKVYEVESGVKRLITDNLESTPKTIDTTVLGTTNVRWVYRYKSINPKSVRVVDKVAPETPTVKLQYADGTEYKAENANGNINVTMKSILMEITTRDYACVLGTTCRSRYPELEGSGVKEIRYRGETDTADRVIPTTNTTTRYTENQTLWGNVNLKAVDNSNNISEEINFEIYLDNEAPSKTTVTYLGGSNSCSWKNNYKLKLNATDNIEVAYYEIYIDGNYYGTTGSEWTPPNNFSNCTTTFRAVDLAGNKGAFSDGHHIHMDTEIPTRTSWWWGEVNFQVARLYIQVSDNASGINRIQCPTATQSGGYNNWYWYNAVWDAGANAYRCDITPNTFNHYDETYQTDLYIYDNAGNGGYYSRTSVKIPPKGYALSQVAKPGDYVIYRPPSTSYVSPSSLNGYGNQTVIPSNYTGSWRVLYNNSSYGLQIISDQITANITLRGYAGINNIYDTLNSISRAYMDGRYALSARHVGTNPTSPSDPSGWCDFHGAQVKCWERTVYITDLNGMNAATSQSSTGIGRTNNIYYLISRQKYHVGDDGNYCVTDSRTLDTGTGNPADICPIFYTRGANHEGVVTSGIRPVITLNGSTLATGSGTASDPWVIIY